MSGLLVANFLWPAFVMLGHVLTEIWVGFLRFSATASTPSSVIRWQPASVSVCREGRCREIQEMPSSLTGQPSRPRTRSFFAPCEVEILKLEKEKGEMITFFVLRSLTNTTVGRTACDAAAALRLSPIKANTPHAPPNANIDRHRRSWCRTRMLPDVT